MLGFVCCEQLYLRYPDEVTNGIEGRNFHLENGKAVSLEVRTEDDELEAVGQRKP